MNLQVLMVGREVSFKTEKIEANPKGNVLEIEQLGCERSSEVFRLLKGLNLECQSRRNSWYCWC